MTLFWEIRLRVVRAQAAEGLRTAEPGDVHPGDEIFEEIIGSRPASRAS